MGLLIGLVASITSSSFHLLFVVTGKKAVKMAKTQGSNLRPKVKAFAQSFVSLTIHAKFSTLSAPILHALINGFVYDQSGSLFYIDRGSH